MNTLPLTIDCSTLAADEERAVALALTTLPESFRRAGAADADVWAVSGRTGWPGRVDRAIAHGARGVLVVGPAVGDAAAGADLARRNPRTPVLLDLASKYSFALADVRAEARALAGPMTLLELTVGIAPGADRDAACVDLLVLARELTGEEFTASCFLDFPAARHLQGVGTSGTVLSLTVTARPVRVGCVDVSMVNGPMRVSITLPAASSAAPGEASVIGPRGKHTFVTEFESAMRRELKALRDSVVRGAAHDDLLAYRAASATLERGKGLAG